MERQGFHIIKMKPQKNGLHIGIPEQKNFFTFEFHHLLAWSKKKAFERMQGPLRAKLEIFSGFYLAYRDVIIDVFVAVNFIIILYEI